MENKTNEQKRILVIEDKLIHQESAKELLKNHDLTIVNTFEGYLEKMYGVYHKKIQSFEVILSDLSFPWCNEGNTYDFRQETHLGYTVPFHSAIYSIPYCAIYTDTDHHDGPIAETFEHFETYEANPPVFQINKTRFMFFDSDSFDTRDSKAKRWDLALGSLLAGKNVYLKKRMIK
ncbi:MAG: hypothetical protein ACOYT4_00090 [Nanoarchaeota archaeon]